MELEALNEIVSELRQAATTIVAITPQITAHNQKLVKNRKLDFDLLFDENNNFARQMDLVHGLPDELQAITDSLVLMSVQRTETQFGNFQYRQDSSLIAKD